MNTFGGEHAAVHPECQRSPLPSFHPSTSLQNVMLCPRFWWYKKKSMFPWTVRGIRWLLRLAAKGLAYSSSPFLKAITEQYNGLNQPAESQPFCSGELTPTPHYSIKYNERIYSTGLQWDNRLEDIKGWKWDRTKTNKREKMWDREMWPMRKTLSLVVTKYTVKPGCFGSELLSSDNKRYFGKIYKREAICGLDGS